MNVGRSGQWRPTVQPYLEELGNALLENGCSERSVALNAAGVRLLLTPLEQELLMGLMGESEQSFARKHILVRDSLGLRLKILAQMAALERAAPEDRDEVINQLNADVGLGCQLMHEITQEMNAITSVGAIDEAKEFSGYRQQLARVVAEAEKRLNSGQGSSGKYRKVATAGYATRLKENRPTQAKKGSGKNGRPTSARQGAASKIWTWMFMACLAGLGAAVVWWFLLR